MTLGITCALTSLLLSALLIFALAFLVDMMLRDDFLVALPDFFAAIMWALASPRTIASRISRSGLESTARTADSFLRTFLETWILWFVIGAPSIDLQR